MVERSWITSVRVTGGKLKLASRLVGRFGDRTGIGGGIDGMNGLGWGVGVDGEVRFGVLIGSDS